MIDKFLKDSLGLVIGKQGEEIVKLLYNKKYINEFLIAKKLDLTINQTRNILYKLLDAGLISSTRKKDKKKGWYTYFWKIEVLKTLQFLRDAVSKKMEQLEHYIKSREKKQFYVCERCNVEYTEENALLHNFSCEECGGVFSAKDNTKIVEDLKRDLEKLRKQREFIDEEISAERGKIDKVRQKEIKKEETEKKEARKSRLAIRKKEAEKNKKAGSKPAKKKKAEKKPAKKEKPKTKTKKKK